MKSFNKKRGDDSNDAMFDVNEVCRLCLAKDKTMVSIYGDEPIPMPLKIMACVNVEVYEKPNLPNMICHTCKYQLEKSYQFKKKCEAADAKLQRSIKNIMHIQKLTRQNKSEIDDLKIEKSIEADQTSDLVSETEDGFEEVTEEELEDEFKLQIENESTEESLDISLNLPEENIAKDHCTIQTYPFKQNQDSDNEDGKEEQFVPNVKRKNAYMIETSDDNSERIELLKLQPDVEQFVPNFKRNKVYMMEVSNNNSEQVESLKLQSVEETVKNEETDANGELKVFKCDKCPKAFTRRMMLKSHQSVHSTQRGFTCSVCEKWFPTNSTLIRHERIHTGEKPFTCNICQRAFTQKEILMRHLFTHSKEKPFKCNECPKSYTQRKALKVHMQLHQKVVPANFKLYHCELCPKAFCHPSRLSKHLLIHAEKTFKCYKCDKTFCDQVLFDTHCHTHNISR